MDNVEDAFRQMGNVPMGVRSEFEEAYALRDAAGRLDGDWQDQKRLFLEAATRFSGVAKLVQTSDFETEEMRAKAMFFAKMESAFCLLSTKDEKYVAAAINIYSEIEEMYPKDPVPLYRHAVALSELNEFEPADAKYAQAQEALDGYESIPNDHWLRRALPRRRGFLYWLRANECDNASSDEIERKVELLILACEFTRRSLSMSKPGSSAYATSCNNLLYYLLDLHYARGGKEVEFDEEMKDCLREMETRVALATALRPQLAKLDTLCRAYVVLRRFADAVLAAERIEHLLAKGPEPTEESTSDTNPMRSGNAYFSITENLNPAERRILDHALWVLRNYGPGPERPETEQKV